MKTKVKLAGKMVTIDTNKPKVAKALVALVEACATRTFPIGMIFDYKNGTEYILSKVHDRAYLINLDTGRARNSRKVVYVQGDFRSEDGLYTEDLPCERDEFVDPDGDGEYIDI